MHVLYNYECIEQSAYAVLVAKVQKQRWQNQVWLLMVWHINAKSFC